MKLLKLSLLLGAMYLFATPGQAKVISCPASIDAKVPSFDVSGKSEINFVGELNVSSINKLTRSKKPELKAEPSSTGSNKTHISCIYPLGSETLTLEETVPYKCKVEEEAGFHYFNCP